MGLEANAGSEFLGAEDLTFINDQLGQGTADPAAHVADTPTPGTTQPPADDSTASLETADVPAPGGAVKEPPSESAAGEKKDAATVAEEEREKKPEVKAVDPAESEPMRVVRTQRDDFKTKLEALEGTVGTLAPIIKSVGAQPITELSTYVTSEKPGDEFAKEFCQKLEAIEPQRYEDTANYLVEESIRADPKPVLEDLVHYHADRIAELLTGTRGATMAQLKESWAARGSKTTAAPQVPKAGETYTGLDELLEDDPEETQAKPAPTTEDELSKLSPALRKRLEEAEATEKRLAAIEERIEKGSETDIAERSQAAGERFLAKAFTPLGAMLKDSGLLVLDGDNDVEKGRKQGAQARIRDRIFQRLQQDPRTAFVTEYLDKGKDPPDVRVTQAQALVEQFADEEIAFYTDQLHRQRTKPTEKLNTDPPPNVPGNNQGRTMPGQVPLADSLEGGRFGDNSLARETEELLNAR